MSNSDRKLKIRYYVRLVKYHGAVINQYSSIKYNKALKVYNDYVERCSGFNWRLIRQTTTSYTTDDGRITMKRIEEFELFRHTSSKN